MQGSGTGRCYGLCTPPKWAGALVHEMRSMRHMCDTVLLEFHACSISVIVMLQYSTNEALGHSPSFLTFTVTCWQLNSLCKMLPESGNRWEIITNNKKTPQVQFCLQLFVCSCQRVFLGQIFLFSQEKRSPEDPEKVVLESMDRLPLLLLLTFFSFFSARAL